MRRILSYCCRGTWRSSVGAFVLVWPCLYRTAENKCFLPAICDGIPKTKKILYLNADLGILEQPKKGLWGWCFSAPFNWCMKLVSFHRFLALLFSIWGSRTPCLHVLCALKFNNCPWITAFMSSKDLIKAIKTWQPACLQTNLLYSVVRSLKSDLYFLFHQMRFIWTLNSDSDKLINLTSAFLWHCKFCVSLMCHPI